MQVNEDNLRAAAATLTEMQPKLVAGFAAATKGFETMGRSWAALAEQTPPPEIFKHWTRIA